MPLGDKRLGLIVCLGSLLVAAFLFRRLRQWQRLRHIPGPPLAGLSRFFWLVPLVRSSRLNIWLQELDKQYGRIVRVGPNTVVTSDWKLWKHVMSARSPYQRSQRFVAFRLDMTNDNIVSSIDEQEHGRLRAMMIHGYSGKEVEGVEAKMDIDILSLVHLLESRYILHNKAFDFGRKAQYFTTDVIAHLAFGKPFGFISTDSDVYNYIEIIGNQFPSMSVLTLFPGLLQIFNWPLLNLLLPTAEDKAGLGKLMGIAKRTAAERFGPDRKVHKDMLGSFVARGLTQKEAEAEILMQVIAGSDTSATTIRTAMLHLATNSRVLRKLQAEIDSVAPYSMSEVIKDETARALPYLSAVVKEILRWLPPAMDIATRVVPPGGDEWNGLALPPGTELGWNAIGIMRDSDVWGDDADQFRPERWIEAEADPDKLRDMNTVGDMVFGGTSRYQCLGRIVALMEIKKVLFELFRRYEFEVMNPGNPWTSRCWFIFVQDEFWLKAHPRQCATGGMV
ncbi:cytochrome P450 [Chaetomidium leptoderma]|uniref:Cytochrome P450 n=1 Tax=Chaetomidium leptoderma TaxID=669021 RepID=A0AAN6VL89_9PEZI|nr:cytochrome P450 [Chaetomidium leptoderma]